MSKSALETAAEQEWTWWRCFGKHLTGIDLAFMVRAKVAKYPANLQRHMFSAIWERIEELWLADVERGA